MTKPTKRPTSPRIVVIGGGTGSFTLLQELKHLTPNVTAIVNMSDDGGSTGTLRDELGVLPPGDIRQCLVALSNLQEVRDLFSIRFGGQGSLAGHSLGNIIIAGLENHYGEFESALRVASNLLQVTGQVVPVTLTNHVLVLHDGDKVMEGEHAIAHTQITHKDAWLELKPKAGLNPVAKVAILQADLLIIAPGNLYGSLLPALAVDGMKQAFAKSRATKIMISNLVTKPGQTDGWHVVDYAKAIERYVGNNQLDFILFNDKSPSRALLQKYAADGEFPVGNDAGRFKDIKAKLIGADLVASDITTQDTNDKAIKRTLIRHNAQEVGRQLMRVHFNQ